jgi:hypothetical protein
MTYRLGVDVGGTFTDLFLVSEGNGGAQFRVKTPSTPHDPSVGFIATERIAQDMAEPKTRPSPRGVRSATRPAKALFHKAYHTIPLQSGTPIYDPVGSQPSGVRLLQARF